MKKYRPNFKRVHTLKYLAISKSRIRTTTLIDKLQNFYDERLIALKKANIFDDLRIIY